MRLIFHISLILLVALPLSADQFPTNVNDGLTVSSKDWPWWRGPQRNGMAFPKQSPPLEWDDSKNVLWRVKVPGRGHGSPVVISGKPNDKAVNPDGFVFIATADRARDLQSVICYDRNSGTQIWESVVHRGGLMKKNKKASQASATIACDGEHIYITFLNDGALYATALTMEGDRIWQKKISDYIIHQGYAASPALYQNLVIVAADNKGGGAVAGLNRKTGNIVWKRDRPAKPNYPSPVLLHVSGKDQMIMTGCDLVSSYDPLTGKTNWEIPGATTECVTSTVTDGQHVYSSGGYPDNHVAAIKADGSGSEVWRNKSRVYVPSMLIKDSHIYAVLDAGIATCWVASTGEQKWKARLGGTFSSSPVLVGDKIYATDEEGISHVFVANSEEFTRLAKNKLGDEVFATPAICNGRIYFRIAKRENDVRQEYLYCIGK